MCLIDIHGFTRLLNEAEKEKEDRTIYVNGLATVKVTITAGCLIARVYPPRVRRSVC
jgi:hypothetical protein